MRNTRILVVDDEHLIRWSLEQSLQKQGYDVITAGSGEDALKRVQEDAPELMLLDIQLPGMDGLEVLEKVKEIDDDILVVMDFEVGGTLGHLHRDRCRRGIPGRIRGGHQHTACRRAVSAHSLCCR